jgi:hypothetical protein
MGFVTKIEKEQYLGAHAIHSMTDICIGIKF